MSANGEIPRRQEILEAALSLFSKKGYHGTSMEDIARIVGVRKRALYHYFPSKEELLFTTLKHPMESFIESIEEISASPNPPSERLRQAFYKHIEALLGHIDMFTVLLNETKYLNGQPQEDIIALRDRYESLFRKLLTEGVEAGELRPLNVKLVTFSIMGMINWMQQWYRPDGMTPNELATHCWEIICGGIMLQGRDGPKGDTA